MNKLQNHFVVPNFDDPLLHRGSSTSAAKEASVFRAD
jgi:hypothetical protein